MLDIQFGERRLGAGVMQVGFAVIRVQTRILAAGIVVPGMRNEFLNLVRIVHVHRMDGGKIAVQDGASRNQPACRIVHPFFRKIAIGEKIADSFAAREPVLVERSDGERVGQIDLIDELLHAADHVLDPGEALHVERGRRGAAAAGGIDADGRRRPAHQEVWMRILAAENGVHLDDFALPGQGFQIMRHGHQIGLRRQLEAGIAPEAVGEDAELAALDEILELFWVSLK